ncbi:ATP-binding protein [Streptomyces sp. ISL-100]|uniref:ATP-binding protein n=1 Tax=Streptomyces sp. ISL-100 TaxID=2819173 RepID=UPI001BEB813F|nr:ATP-binding protein [Streptomyces sp. ISL-100]MBT2401706.1 ATP-binding protein [Streptomyces sp. ISL-100]
MSQVRPALSQLALADTPNAAAWARRRTVDVLRHWHVPPDHIETARLIVSELATNAIQHPQPSAAGSPEPRTLTVTLRLLGPRLVIYVGDHDRRPPILRAAGAAATSGRGLLLVEMMSHRWGYYHPPASGKVVWAELALDAASRVMPDAGESGPVAGDPLLMGQVLVGLREL